MTKFWLAIVVGTVLGLSITACNVPAQRISAETKRPTIDATVRSDKLLKYSCRDGLGNAVLNPDKFPAVKHRAPESGSIVFEDANGNEMRVYEYGCVIGPY